MPCDEIAARHLRQRRRVSGAGERRAVRVVLAVQQHRRDAQRGGLRLYLLLLDARDVLLPQQRHLIFGKCRMQNDVGVNREGWSEVRRERGERDERKIE